MNSTEYERCEDMAAYMIENDTTVRQCAARFGVSKSTVHKDITQRLYYINRELYYQVRKLLQKNKAERHLRGGEATRAKYLHQHRIPTTPGKTEQDT